MPNTIGQCPGRYDPKPPDALIVAEFGVCALPGRNRVSHMRKQFLLKTYAMNPELANAICAVGFVAGVWCFRNRLPGRGAV